MREQHTQRYRAARAWGPIRPLGLTFSLTFPEPLPGQTCPPEHPLNPPTIHPFRTSSFPGALVLSLLPLPVTPPPPPTLLLGQAPPFHVLTVAADSLQGCVEGLVTHKTVPHTGTSRQQELYSLPPGFGGPPLPCLWVCILDGRTLIPGE